MENISSRTWTFLGFAGLLLFMTQWMKWMGMGTGTSKSASAFTYEMPRPDQYEPEFSLSGREIEKSRIQLPALPTLKNNAVKTSERKADPKKAQEDKKRQALLKAAELARKAALARKNKVEVKSINTNRIDPMSASGSELVVDRPIASVAYQEVKEAKAKSEVANHIAAKDEDLDLSPSKWRALLQADPSAANAKKFAKAKALKKIDSKNYYEIVHDLLVDSAADRRSAAKMILSQDINVASYEFLISESSSAPADSKLVIQSALNEYSQATKINTLLQVMLSSKVQSAVVSASAQLNTSFQSFKQIWTANNQDPNKLRLMSGGFTLQTFTNMTSILRRIASTSSNPASSQAGQLATEIQNLQK